MENISQVGVYFIGCISGIFAWNVVYLLHDLSIKIGPLGKKKAPKEGLDKSSNTKD